MIKQEGLSLESDLEIDFKRLELYTLPLADQNEEQRLLDCFAEAVPGRYNTALVIGRFQPLHYGHIYLIKQALCIAKNVVIGIGSANVRNADNPFSYQQREKMLLKALSREGLVDSVVNIVPLYDYTNDDFWLKETIKKAGRIDVVVGNNGWVNEIFESAEIPAEKIPMYKRGILCGTEIRRELRKEGHLFERI